MFQCVHRLRGGRIKDPCISLSLLFLSRSLSSLFHALSFRLMPLIPIRPIDDYVQMFAVLFGRACEMREFNHGNHDVYVILTVESYR